MWVPPNQSSSHPFLDNHPLYFCTSMATGFSGSFGTTVLDDFYCIWHEKHFPTAPNTLFGVAFWGLLTPSQRV